MIEFVKSSVFEEWLDDLRDQRAKAKVKARIRRLSLGNPGDVKPVGEGISEMRISYGPGYRVYFLQHGMTLVVLLCGGDKSTQAKDIENAKELARIWKEGNDE
ncbi:MAG TPA: type II toxin-antitoxin system RelE/ParE family toxin [Hyphomonadaceae bacterium]|nr:type II toxin-antitoxin system RelE/ParE family toxin [Hyphomonadaceae bacterium]